MVNKENGAANGNGEKLAKLLQGMNWPTVALVALTGGGNLMATFQNRSQIDYGRERVMRQVNDLHEALDATERRQKEAIAHFEELLVNDKHEISQLSTSLANQTKMLENQNKVMGSQMEILEGTHAMVSKFEKWKAAEQMRGVPP